METILYDLPLFPLLLVCLGLALGVAGLFHALLWSPAGRNLAAGARGMAPVMQGIIATFAAFSVTFLSSGIWQVENHARETVDMEARNLRLVVTFAAQMPASERERLVVSAMGYASAVADVEWAEMVSNGSSSEVDAQLYTLYSIAAGLPAADAIRAPLLSSLDNLALARDSRLIQAKEAVMPTQWVVVLVLMGVLLAVVAISHGHDSNARAIALTLTALAIGVSLFGILARDRPFIGYLAITPRPIQQAAGL